VIGQAASDLLQVLGMAEQRRVDLLNLARQQLLEQGGQSLGATVSSSSERIAWWVMVVA
jgi:hypothetical protein